LSVTSFESSFANVIATSFFLLFLQIFSDYPDGSTVICTGQFCSNECATVGCPTLTEGTTCSNLRFCYTEDSGSDVWKLPNEVALANCDFTEAEPVCSTTEGADEDCCNYVVEEDAVLGPYFFASKDGCAEGQKTAFNIADYDSSGNSCYNSGLGSSRIAKCTCLATNTLVEPCASEFQQGCLYNSPEDTACCADESCVANSKNYEHPDGKTAEDDRVKLCLDPTPGRCVVKDVADCCTQTCSGCGIQLHPEAVWETCETGNSTDLTGECGRSYSWATNSYTPNICDFAACEETSFWHQETEAVKQWIANFEPEPVETFIGCYDTSDNKCKCETNYCGEAECTTGGRIWTPGCPTDCVCTPAMGTPTKAPTLPPTSAKVSSSDDSSGASDFSRMAAMLVPGLLLVSLSHFA